MGRRKNGLGHIQNKLKVDTRIPTAGLDYHEGLSFNQVKVILAEVGLGNRHREFGKWLYGQTCPMVERYNRDSGKKETVIGVYEYDLFRWIANKKHGTPLVWD